MLLFASRVLNSESLAVIVCGMWSLHVGPAGHVPRGLDELFTIYKLQEFVTLGVPGLPILGDYTVKGAA